MPRGTIHVNFKVDLRGFSRSLAKFNAAFTASQVRMLRGRDSHRRADRLKNDYVAKHGICPFEHNYRLMVERKLASDRWSPQP